MKSSLVYGLVTSSGFYEVAKVKKNCDVTMGFPGLAMASMDGNQGMGRRKRNFPREAAVQTQSLTLK